MALDGVLIIDKPCGPSSAQVVGSVKRLLGAKKVGHAGTLDPSATGVLVCCVNQATRLAAFFLASEKRYEAELHLGIETDTQDAQGHVVASKELEGISAQGIREALESFVGVGRQVPPAYSALKHEGVPLYRLNRSGIRVTKPDRPIEIFSLRILELQPPVVRFVVSCSAGTYIRTLCADVGRALGCGGHLKSLRRLASGAFSLDRAFTLGQLEAAAAAGRACEMIIPMVDALPRLPALVADETAKGKIRHGRLMSAVDFNLEKGDLPEGPVKIVDPLNRLLAVVEHRRSQPNLTYRCVFR